MIGFDLYEIKAKEIKDELVGLKISNDINYEITDFSTHFIDRVLGQSSTSHKGMRLGTTIEQLKDSIANPRKISEPFLVNMKKNGKEYLDERINITGKSCSFVYSVKDKLVVQATSFGEDIMIIINDKNKKFVKNHIPKADEILNSASVRDALEAFSDWLDMNPDCWDENGYDYSDLGRQAQKVYDDILYDNVYANKSNA